MKKIFLASTVLLLYVTSSGQHTELSAGLNAGVFSFRGPSAVSSSFVILATNFETGNYTNNLYSKKPGIGIGLDIAIQRVTKKRFIYGIGTGMELLKHNIPITAVSDITGSHPATGEIHIHSHFINIKPIAGHRFVLSKKATLDLTASTEFAIGLAYLYEVGVVTITSGGQKVTVENDRDEIITDFRPGLQAKLNAKRYSLLAGYWLGQTNYYKGYVGANPEAYSKLFRLGLSYRLNRSK